MKKYISVDFGVLFFNLFFCQTEKKTIVYYNYSYKIDSTSTVNNYNELSDKDICDLFYLLDIKVF